ncbi:hypothetical protein [Haliangium sp.]|uniref:hypothetical protein n=1 Tax=Haliangium sp. TaxID=2663208 RepID=UPI003D0AEC42
MSRPARIALIVALALAAAAPSAAGQPAENPPESVPGDDPSTAEAGAASDDASADASADDSDSASADGAGTAPSAAPPPTPDQPRPWAEGVSATAQERARTLHEEANDLMLEYLLDEAMDKYREALTHWQHPAIHYNLARALDSLGRPLEAYAHLQEARRYGAAPFESYEYPQLQNFRRNLERKLSIIEVECLEAGAEITIDGRLLFVGPGRTEQVLLPGEHILVASKPGEALMTRTLALERGTRTTLALATRQRWRPWQPWAVVAAGAAAGAIGGVVQWRATVNMDRYRGQFAELCETGCREEEFPSLAQRRRRAESQNRVGVAALSVGGAVALTGIVLVIANQSRSFRVDLGRRDDLSLAPLVSPTLAGAAFAVRF